MSMRYSFDDGGHGIARFGMADEERFGRSKAKVEVEADGDMVLVVCDVEGDNLFLFLLLLLDEGEDETPVGGVCAVHLEVLTASVDKRLVLDSAAIRHQEMESLAFLIG